MVERPYGCAALVLLFAALGCLLAMQWAMERDAGR